MAMAGSGLCMGCMSPLGEYIVCPRCGYDNSTAYDRKYKQPGSILGGRYLVGRLVRKNGEGAMYIGYDNSLQTTVWIREYFPHTIAERDLLTGDITPVNGYGAQYKALMSDFADICNEVKRLSVTGSVIPIENAFQECNTVYAIYKDMDVIQLEEYLVSKGGRLPLVHARRLLLPLCNTLSNMHSRGEIHRGISPYTVFIDEGDRLYLWDFAMSAARTANSELEAELFNGYSAPEQYASNGWQGSWTDVYAVAALLYRMVSGFVPPKSTLIGEGRPLAPLMDLVDIPKNVSDAVDEAMKPVSEERTQTVAAFTGRLMETELSNTAVFETNKVQQARNAQKNEPPPPTQERRGAGGKYVALGLLITAVALVGFLWIFMSANYPDLLHVEDDSSVSSSQSSRSEESVQSSESVSSDSSKEEKVDKTVPSFVGKAATDIVDDKQYEDRFIFSTQEDYNQDYPEGIVYAQSPLEGTLMPNRGTVILKVSKGVRIVEMPDVTGKTLEEAMEILGKDDIAYTEIERIIEGAKPGTVVSTTPTAGTKFDPKTDPVYVFYMPGPAASESSGAPEEDIIYTPRDE